MADAAKNEATAPAPAKRKRAAFTRTEKPAFAVVTYRDENGAITPLVKERLSITIEKDAAKLVELVTGSDMGGATVVRVTMPQGPKRNAPAIAAVS